MLKYRINENELDYLNKLGYLGCINFKQFKIKINKITFNYILN
jgi:hypothetical protein